MRHCYFDSVLIEGLDLIWEKFQGHFFIYTIPRYHLPWSMCYLNSFFSSKEVNAGNEKYVYYIKVS